MQKALVTEIARAVKKTMKFGGAAPARFEDGLPG